MTPEEHADILLSEMAWPVTVDGFKNQQLYNNKLIAKAIRDAYRRAADVALRRRLQCNMPHPIQGCPYCISAGYIENWIKDLM